jgi:hypothetical protein
VEAPTPLRPDEEVAGGYISATLGGQVKRLPVLPRARNRGFQKVYGERIRTTIENAGKLDDLEDVIEMMSSSIDEMLDVVLIYDESASLGGREWIDTHATDREIYNLFKQVTHAAHPFGKDLLAVVPDLRALLLRATLRMAGSRSTSSSRRSTAGSRKRSKTA